MLRALLDTGSTHTFAPLDAVEGLELKAVDISRVEDFSGLLRVTFDGPARSIVVES